MMTHRCPVCGYKELSRPPQDDTICPCCGTHFGYHDYATTYEELRARWISTGAHWFSHSRPQPPGWDGMTQLLESGLAVLFGAASGKTVVEGDFPLDLSQREVKVVQQLSKTA